jgi:hypothetical protein
MKQTMIYKTLHRKLKFENHEPTKIRELDFVLHFYSKWKVKWLFVYLSLFVSLSFFCCVFCSSLNFGFWLPLLYFKTSLYECYTEVYCEQI